MVEDDLKDLIVDNPTNEDYKRLGQYLIRKKMNAFRSKLDKIRGFFHGDKSKNND